MVSFFCETCNRWTDSSCECCSTFERMFEIYTSDEDDDDGIYEEEDEDADVGS